VFCPVSQPNYRSFDLDPELLTNIVNNLPDRFPETVVVNGHGETTVYPHWNEYCNSLLDAGLPLHIISNFAKKLSAQEIETLSRFQSVQVSCDSHDPDLFCKLRRGADLNTLRVNIEKIQAARVCRGRKTPSLSFSCVVSDRNVLQLPEYVVFGKNLGIDQFTFCNLTKHPDLVGTLNCRHITEMEFNLLPSVREAFTNCLALLKKDRINYYVQPGLFDSLEEKMRSGDLGQKEPSAPSTMLNVRPLSPPQTAENLSSGKRPPKQLTSEWRYSSSRPESSTRDCLDPWNFILFHANSEVRPCCWQNPVLTLGKRQSITDAFNCLQVKKLRYQLLSGDLPGKCLHCPSRGWTTRADLLKKVKKYLYPALLQPSFWRRSIPEMPKPIDVNVLYNQGWYPEEHDEAAINPDRRHYRWISQQAHCTMQNPRCQAVLFIRGFVHPEILQEQKLKIYIGSEMLDEFFPLSEKFVIEYAVPPENWGDTNTVSIVLESTKAFVPKQTLPGNNDDRDLALKIYQLQLF